MKRAAWGLMTLLSIGVGAYALAVLGGLVPNDFLDKFSSYRGWANLHFLGGAVALLCGPWQFSRGLRSRHLGLHRALGRVYLVGVLCGAVGGLYMAPRATGDLPSAAGFGLLSVLWIVTAAAAYTTIRRGDVMGHRRWMTRNYALAYAAVTLRFYLPVSQALGYDFDAAYAAIAWLCWVPNLIVVEWLLLADLGPRTRGTAAATTIVATAGGLPARPS